MEHSATTNDEASNPQTIVTESLAEWVVTSRIPHKHVNGLLQILNKKANLDFVPLDCRTLLKTKRGKLTFVDMPPGKYYHLGVASALVSVLDMISSNGHPIPDVLRILFNVDGIPLTNSSSSEFWPILCKVIGKKRDFSHY